MLAGYSWSAEEMLFLEGEEHWLHLCQDVTYALHESFIVEAMGRSVKFQQGQTRPMQD